MAGLLTIGSAFLVEELEMNAACAPRKGRSAVAGLAVVHISITIQQSESADILPRSAIAVADLVVANISSSTDDFVGREVTNGAKEWRGEPGIRVLCWWRTCDVSMMELNLEHHKIWRLPHLDSQATPLTPKPLIGPFTASTDIHYI